MTEEPGDVALELERHRLCPARGASGLGPVHGIGRRPFARARRRTRRPSNNLAPARGFIVGPDRAAVEEALGL